MRWDLKMQDFKMVSDHNCITTFLLQLCRGFTKGTIFSSVFNLLTTSIGAGTLALPYAFKEGGIVFSSILFFMILIIAIIAGFYLFDSQKHAKEVFPSVEIRGYADLAEVALGKLGRVTVLIVLLLFLYLALVAYMIYARDQLELIIRFGLTKTDHEPHCSLLQNCAIIMVIAFIPIFPITLLKNMSLFQVTSTISILCIGFVAVVISIKSGEHYHLSSNTSSIVLLSDSQEFHVALYPSSIQGAITCVSYCSLCFICHFNLFAIERELYRPKRWKMNFIIVTSMVTAYLIYNVVGFAGYIQFGGITKEDIMTNYRSDSILVTSARIALFLTLLFSYPVLFHPTRATINELYGYLYVLLCEHSDRIMIQRGDSESTESEVLLNSNTKPLKWRSREREMMYRTEPKPNRLVWVCESWIIFSLSFLPAAFIPNVGYVWNFVGSIGGTLILYVFPSLFYIRLRYFSHFKTASETGASLLDVYLSCSIWKDALAGLITVLGVIVLLAGNYVAVLAILNGTHEPLSKCQQLDCGVFNSSN